MRQNKTHSSAKFHPLRSDPSSLFFRVGILTCSTRFAKEHGDKSALAIHQIIGGPRLSALYQSVRYKLVPDNFKIIAKTLKNWCDREKLDLILTTGGTGFSPTDVTPEATKSILERETPGLAEAMRIFSSEFGVWSSEFKKHLTPNTQLPTLRSFLSRGVCGIRKKTLILNLPGSPRGAKECLKVVLPLLPHALELLGAAGSQPCKGQSHGNATATDRHA